MMELHFLHLNGVSIFEQLQIEEALLRTDTRNWCIINTDANPAIVMGISGKPEELLNLPLVHRDQIPIIKRFSGGGTVYIDPQTFFVTFICQSNEFKVAPQPVPIMKWSEELYRPFFSHPEFRLKENDYVMGEKKFGGNAQYIKKDRWLHHTSFLWDIDFEKMEYLSLPKKRPEYRQNRSHKDFLCSLSSYYSQKTEWIESFKNHLKEQFHVREVLLENMNEVLLRPHRKSTTYLTLNDFDPGA